MGEIVAGEAVEVGDQRVDLVAEALAQRLDLRIARARRRAHQRVVRPGRPHDRLPQVREVVGGAGEARGAGSEGVEERVAGLKAGNWELVGVVDEVRQSGSKVFDAPCIKNQGFKQRQIYFCSSDVICDFQPMIGSLGLQNTE